VLFDPKTYYERLPLINHGNDGRYSITEGDWKLILPHGKHAQKLYDLATDPAETSDLAAIFPERVKSLKVQVTSVVLDGRTTPGQPQVNDTGYWKDLSWISKMEYAKRQKQK